MIKIYRVMMPTWGLLLSLLLVLGNTWRPGKALQLERCAAQTRQILVNPDAEAFIGVVLPVRAAGAGLLGCGLPTQDGVELLEALRWATGVLNSGSESLIPGVKLGLRIWDTCGHPAAVVHALSELVPVLREGPALCTPGLASSNNSALLVGIVDGAGATRDPATRLTLAQYSIPVLVLEPETLVAVEDRAKAVISLALELQWRQVALVYGADDYGTRMYRAAVRLAADSDLCVISAERLGSEDDDRAAALTLASVRSAAAVASATPRGSNVTGVLVMSRRSHYIPLLSVLRHSDTSGLHWLFSDLLTTSDLSNGLYSDRFYSLTLAPPSIPPFEQYWANQVQQSGRGIDNNLVQEYEMTRRGCRLPGWAGPNISELPNCSEPPKRDSPDSLRAALRGRNAAAALHVVHTLAYALRAAWRETCQDQGPGVCPSLRLVARQEFSSKYLTPLEFDHSAPGNRVSGVPRGGKLRAGDPSEMAASSLALLSYRGDRSAGNQKLHKLFEYHLDGVEVSDRSFRSTGNRVDLSCSDDEGEGQCPRCLKLREARVRGSTSIRSVSPSAGRLPTHHTISSPQQVYVAGLFSVHAPPAHGSPLLGGCGPLIPSAARQVEAFTWALRRANERILAPLGIKLGAILLDTCQSTARALTLPAALVGETSVPILAAVNALADEEARAATAVFSAMNITSVATQAQRTKEERYSMQIGPAASSMAAALQGVLQHLGWDYVSVVTSQNDEAAQLGVRFLRKGSLCIATEENIAPDDMKLESMLTRLVAARDGGARGVVLWTRAHDTRKLLTTVARARSQGTLKGEDLFWLVVNPQGDATAVLEEFGDVIGGALVFSPEQKPVRDFLQYLRRLRPDEIRKMDDNPWLESYHDQVLQACTGSECDRAQQQLLEEGTPQDARTVQAVFALAAAVARARLEHCPELPPGLPGVCPPGGNRPDMKQVLNALLHYTPSERAAGGGDEFKFTPRGAGDVAIEILNLRRGGARVKSRGLSPGINFEKVGVYRGEMQNIASLLGYRDSGEEVQLATLTSRCTRSCSRCRSTDRFLVTHPASDGQQTLYLGVTLGMREPATAHPLECGSEASTRGVQQLEALLWALDIANMNSSVRLSAVVMNSCGSAARTSRDIAQLLDDERNDKFISDQLVTMLSADGPSVADRITNLAVPLGLPVITTDSTYIKPYKPYPLQLNAGLRMRTQTLMSLTRRLEWTAVSVIHVEDGACSEAMLRTAQTEARRLGINIATTVTLDDWRGEQEDEAARQAVLMVRDKSRDSGVKAVMLLLTRRHLERVFRATRMLQNEGELVPGEIIWLGVADEDLFQTYSNQTRGSLVVQPQVGWVPEFESHFRSLNLSYAVSRDPWFSDFWASVFRCRGTACGSGLYKDLTSYQMEQDPEVVNIINAVMTVSHAIESVRRELCPEHGTGECTAMSDIPRVRRRLLDITPHMAFVGAGMSGIAFSTAGGDNVGAGLRVLNVRRVGSNVFGLVPVGAITASGAALDLQQDTVKAYAADLTEMALGDVISECRDCGSHDKQRTHMEVSPGNPVTILGVGSIHSPLTGSLSHCGPLRSPDAIQRAAALAFAVEKANLASNVSSLSALLLDDCSLPSRAIYQTYRYLADTSDNSSVFISSASTVALTLLVDNVPNEGLAALLTSQGIPLVMTEEEEAVIRARLHAAVGIAHELGWSRLTVVRSENSRWSKRASDMLLEEILPVMKLTCLGSELVLDISSDHLGKNLQPEITSPLLLLLETSKETEQVLNALAEVRHRSRVIIASGWDASISFNNTVDAEIFTVGQDVNSDVVPGFREYIASAVTSNSGSLPGDWLAEFLETANGGKWHQAPGVAEIVRIVGWVAEEVKRLCHPDDETPLCGQDPQKFREEIKATLTAKMSIRAPNLILWRHNIAKSYERVGSWKKSNGLNVSVKKWRRIDGSECESYRIGRSGKLTSVLEELQMPPVSLLGELRVLWGVVCASISVLGALLTVALVVYFTSATKRATGTSILGYQILFGVLMLYGSNFAFLMAPSEITCLARRLLPGLAYAVILSGMLVKVVTTWRCQGCTKGSLPDGDPLSRPCGLLCCSLSLVVVQAFLAGGWLLLIPADVEPPTSLDGVWTCAAASGRELLGSLSFLAALLLTTAFVSLRARKDGESRSILACCILLALAGAAWVAAANSPTLAEHHRDCVAGVIAGLVSATLVLLCVFVPKLLQHARMSREQERQQHAAAIMSSHSKLQPVMYGVPHYPSISSPHTLVIKAFPEPDELLGVERMMTSRNSRGDSDTTLEDDASEPELAAIRDAEERSCSGSSGSGRGRGNLDHTLEVPSPLYPMDMFTGPPPTTSTFGHGAPPPPPMPRFSLVDHRVPGSNEFTAPPSEGDTGGDTDLSRHEGISYI